MPKFKISKSVRCYIESPFIQWKQKSFKFYEPNVLPTPIKVKYPSIKSFIGIGIENPSYRSSIAIYDGGLYGLVLEGNGRSYISVDQLNNVIVRSNDNLSNDYTDCNINQFINENRDLNDDLF